LGTNLYFEPMFALDLRSDPNGVRWLSYCPGSGVLSAGLL
jgi:hypothetical protein